MTPSIVPIRRSLPTPSRAWRWGALAVVVGNILFNYVYPQLGVGVADIREVSARYENLFTPENYAFAIWALIYTAFATWAVVQLAPSQRSVRFHDRIAGPMIAVNILTSLWVVAFTYQQILLSTAIMVASLATGIFLYARAEQARRHENLSRYWTAGIYMFLGWISVATLAQGALTAVALDWTGGPLTPASWAMLLIATASLLATFMALRFGDPVFPLVVSWALFAIGVHDQIIHPQVSAVAVGGGAICAGLAVSTFLALLANFRTPIESQNASDIELQEWRKAG